MCPTCLFSDSQKRYFQIKSFSTIVSGIVDGFDSTARICSIAHGSRMNRHAPWPYAQWLMPMAYAQWLMPMAYAHGLCPWHSDSIGDDPIGHNYIGHNYIGHNYILPGCPRLHLV